MPIYGTNESEGYRPVSVPEVWDTPTRLSAGGEELGGDGGDIDEIEFCFTSEGVTLGLRRLSGEGAPERWRCYSGHTFPEPFKIEMMAEDKIYASSGPTCPHCFTEWMAKNFYAEQVE